MKKGNKKVLWIVFSVIIILIIGIFFFKNIQTAFLPNQNILTQYTNTNQNLQGGCGQGTSDAQLSQAIKSNDVSINTGVNTFSFKLLETHGAPNTAVCSGTPCQANVDVLKDNVKIDTITADKGVQSCSQLDSNLNVPKTYCDSLNNCVEVKVVNGYSDGANCINSWELNYKLIPSINSVVVNVTPVSNTNIHVKVKNNLNIKLTGDIKNVYEATTVLGTQKVENDTTLILNPLEEKIYNINIPELKQGDSYNVYSVLTLNSYGDIYNSLNYGYINKNVNYVDCGTGRDSTSVDMGSKLLAITNERIIPYAVITSDTFKVEYQNTQVVITPVESGNIEVPSTSTNVPSSTTTTTSTTFNPLKNTSTNFWIVLSVILVIIVLVVIVILNFRRKK